MEKKVAFVFVGCGGTFWCASPMLAALVKRYKPSQCVFIDPDILEPRNLERQWVHSQIWRQWKAELGADSICTRNARTLTYRQKFQDGSDLLRDELEGVDVVVICNVDSDPARLAIRRWCATRGEETVMILSGCDTHYGQVYYGWWKNGEVVRDWLESHPDVTDEEKPSDPCGQNVMSNALSGVLLGLALEEVMPYVRTGHLPTEVKEWYWKREGCSLKTWTDTEKCKEVVHV